MRSSFNDLKLSTKRFFFQEKENMLLERWPILGRKQHFKSFQPITQKPTSTTRTNLVCFLTLYQKNSPSKRWEMYLKQAQ